MQSIKIFLFGTKKAIAEAKHRINGVLVTNITKKKFIKRFCFNTTNMVLK